MIELSLDVADVAAAITLYQRETRAEGLLQ
jgi:hypothetical protein